MPLTDSLVSYWALDEVSNGSGAVTREDSHGTNDLTDNNTTPSAAGKISNAASFTAASNEWLNIADNATLQLGAFDWTFTCWINANNITTDMGIISRHTGNNTDSSFAIRIPTAGRITITTISGSTATQTSSALGTITAGNWHFVACWWDEDAKRANVQIDNGAIVQSAVIGTPNAGTVGLEIGRRSFSTVFDFDGLIDEVGFWKRELTTDELTRLYNSGNGLAYPFFTTYNQSVSGTGTFTASIVKQISKTLSVAASWAVTLAASYLEAFRPTVRIAERPADSRTAVVPARVSSVVGRDEE